MAKISTVISITDKMSATLSKMANNVNSLTDKINFVDKAINNVNNNALSPEIKNGDTITKAKENIEKIGQEANKSAKKTEELGKTSLDGVSSSAKSLVSTLGDVASKAGSAATKLAGMAVKGSVKAITAGTAAMGGLAAASVKTGMDFESSMSQVQATMLLDKSTAQGKKDFETLKKAAQDMGATTQFTASEAAEGLNYLALAGYSADKAATALPTVLRLASAGAMDLASASDMVTDSMSALGIEATEQNLNDFSDKLAKTASVSNTSVSQLGEAILTVGANAKNLKGKTTELNTVLGILADSGIKGAEGGTHLRNMMISLQSPTDKAAIALKKLGVSVYDSKGNMRGFDEIFGDMQKSMTKMKYTSKEVDQTMSSIFNSRDLASAKVLLSATKVGTATEGSGSRFEELTQKINGSAGAAEEMSKIQLDNLKGDVTLLSSAFDGLKNSIYDAGLGSSLRGMTQQATEYIGQMDEAFKTNGFSGLATSFGSIIADVITKFSEAFPRFIELGSQVVKQFLAGISGNAQNIGSSIANVITSAITNIGDIGASFINVGLNVINNILNGIMQSKDKIISGLLNAIKDAINSLVTMLPQMLTMGMELINSLIQGIADEAPGITSKILEGLMSALVSIVDKLPDFLMAGFNLICGLIDGFAQALPKIIPMAVNGIVNFIKGITSKIPQIIDTGVKTILSLVKGILKSLPSLLTAGFKALLAWLGGIYKAIPSVWKGIWDILVWLWDLITDWDFWCNMVGEIVDNIIDAICGFASDIWDAICSVFSWGDDDDITEKGKKAGTNYSNGVKNGVSKTADNAANNSNTAVANSLSNSGSIISDAGNNAGGAYTTGFSTGVSGSAPAIAQASQNALTRSLNSNNSVTEAGQNTGKKYLQGVSNGVSIWSQQTATNTQSTLVDSLNGQNNAIEKAGQTAGGQYANGVSTGISNGIQNAEISNSIPKVDLTENISSSVADNTSAITSNINASLANVSLSEAGEKVVKTFMDGFSNATLDFTTLTDNIKKGLEKVSLTDTGQKVFGTFIDGFNAKKDSFIKATSDMATKVKNTFTLDLQTQGGNILNTLTTGFNNSTSKTLKTIEEMTRQVKMLFSSIDLVDVGANIIKGLINGINSKKMELLLTVEAIGEAISNKLTDVLDIHSPSRVAFSIGKFFDMGLINGLNSMTNKIVKASSHISDSVSEPAKQTDYGSLNLDDFKAGGGNSNAKEITINLDFSGGNYVIKDETDIKKLADYLTETLEEALYNSAEGV